MRRRNVFDLRLDDAELDRLKQIADSLGVSANAWLRMQIRMAPQTVGPAGSVPAATPQSPPPAPGPTPAGPTMVEGPRAGQAAGGPQPAPDTRPYGEYEHCARNPMYEHWMMLSSTFERPESAADWIARKQKEANHRYADGDEDGALMKQCAIEALEDARALCHGQLDARTLGTELGRWGTAGRKDAHGVMRWEGGRRDG